ncbi:hypothetical protein HIM_08621 [Hirsutella minnesotensis 3608]|uniref:Cyanovirin-N domain-containing protein n=1 Tax=Hirsutella minnesotensis 3608 TaxID=1043627 RepID=A0A0F7ZSU9_9HYPO|nr:hypothetical protein HIM_08621 [Hirsutella minnesotensis 3608]
MQFSTLIIAFTATVAHAAQAEDASFVNLALGQAMDTSSFDQYNPTGDIKNLIKEGARVAGCFAHRLGNDIQQIPCGGCGNQSKGNNLAGCVCNNQKLIGQKLKASLNHCVNQNVPFGGLIKSLGLGAVETGLAGLCGAYGGGGGGETGGNYGGGQTGGNYGGGQQGY